MLHKSLIGFFAMVLALLAGCNEGAKNPPAIEEEAITIVANDYELIKAGNSETLLILFPGGGGTSKDTKAEFDIAEKATDNNISVLFMNFNLHFWLDEETAQKLSANIDEIVNKNGLNTNKVFIGGMSIGGNVALLLANHLSKSNAELKPKGVFVVDSPIDLQVLYQTARKDVSRNDFSEDRLAEPRFIIDFMERAFGDSSHVLANVQSASPIIVETEHLDNIAALEDCEVRFYTEPDSLWWMENRQTDFENTNSFLIQQSVEILKGKGWNKVQLIESKNKGYRANGERHPHSWSIVDVDGLIDWMKD